MLHIARCPVYQPYSERLQCTVRNGLNGNSPLKIYVNSDRERINERLFLSSALRRLLSRLSPTGDMGKG